MKDIFKILFLLGLFLFPGWVIWHNYNSFKTKTATARGCPNQTADMVTIGTPPVYIDIDRDGQMDVFSVKRNVLYFAHGIGEGQYSQWLPIYTYPSEIKMVTLKAGVNPVGQQTLVSRAWTSRRTEFDQYVSGIDSEQLPMITQAQKRNP
jgi:desulfoferrodoxin (superoxide reductase-like protein)